MNNKALNLIDKIQNKLNEVQNIIGGREAVKLGFNIVDFDPEPAQEIAQRLAKKLNAQLGKELGRGAMGIVYEMRGESGKGREMVLKITQFPHEKTGYTLARWKKRQLEHKNPKIASILPDIGQVVDIVYDMKGGYLAGRAIKVYGIPIERLNPLPARIKEQLFGHGSKFKSKKAEKEWLSNVSDPKILLPVLRNNFKHEDELYAYFAEIAADEASGSPGKTKLQLGQEFEQLILALPPPKSFDDYSSRWIPQIKRRAMRYADNSPTSSSLTLSPKRQLEHQLAKLAKRLEDTIRIPQYPPNALKYFGIEGAHPSGEEDNPVGVFFSKLQALGPEGVRYWDTHRDNIMMRPATNELVVSDVGLFKHKSQIQEATRASKEGVGLPSVAEQITKYLTDDERPQYYMQFSDIDKLGINPQSDFNTPLGIYSYPITQDTLQSLYKGQLPYATERNYIIVFKIRDNTNIIFNNEPYNSTYFKNDGVEPGAKGGISRDQFLQYVEKLFNPEFIRKYDKHLVTGRAAINRPFLRGIENEVEKHKSGYIYGPVQKKMLRDIIRKVAAKEYPPLLAKYEKSSRYKAMVDKYILEMLSAPFGKVADISKIRQYGKYMVPGEEKSPSFGGRAQRAIKKAWSQLEEMIMRDYVEYKAIPTKYDIKGHTFSRGPDIESEDATTKFMELVTSGNFSSTMERSRRPSHLGFLWSITRDAAHKDARVWASMLRSLGIDGIVDTQGGGVIHESEPTQGVFFSRSAIELEEIFQNELTPEKVRERGASEYLPYYFKAFVEIWGRKPNKEEKDKFIYRLSAGERPVDDPKSKEYSSIEQYARKKAQEIGTETEKERDMTPAELIAQMI